MPTLSAHFQSRQPSDIRLAQIEFSKRKDGVIDLNTAIGNVSLPMPPALQKRMFALHAPESPFHTGVVKYTPTVGTEEATQAFSRVLQASGCSTENLHIQITEGGSEAMGLMILGCCGPAGTNEKPLLVIDAAYTNYLSFAQRLGRKVVSMQRELGEEGKYSLPNLEEIRALIKTHQPGALLVIPYDNPTGHFYDQATMVALAKICVEADLWMVSDEAYRELYYLDDPVSSIWRIRESEVPGITGRRISLETASKVWNACGLRIGALITDNGEFFTRSVAENTANLCPNAIGQYIFGALAHESVDDLKAWFQTQRSYYQNMMRQTTEELKKRLPGVIVSSPEASIYSVVDVRNIAPAHFNSREFVLYCAREGRVELKGRTMTLLVAPMGGFYNVNPHEKNPGDTQMRLAYVLPPEEMALVPELFAALFKSYLLHS